MPSSFQPERLKKIRESLGINKSEAARLLDMTKMGYGRYESGERIPSNQVIEIISQRFGTSPGYLMGTTVDPSPEYIVIAKSSAPELFGFVQNIINKDEYLIERLKYYLNSINSEEQSHESQSL